MTNEELFAVTMAQSAIDCGCEAEDFSRAENRIVRSKPHPDARRYLKLPHVLNLVSYGHGVVASAGEGLDETARDYLERFPGYRAFETPAIHWLSERLQPLDAEIRFMAEYWLPDVSRLEERPCALETRLLTSEDFRDLYIPAWGNALCADRKELDILGVGAYDGGQLAALAACSADCDSMWQIGIDVLSAYRGRGLATVLVTRLAREILARGKVPFYCCAWSNVASARTAIRSGFLPAWVELTARPR